MPVAGLVLTLSPLDGLRSAALGALTDDPRITLGELQPGARLPIATATDSLVEQQDLWNELARTPGVLLVDLAFHDASDLGEFSSDDLPSRWRKHEP